MQTIRRATALVGLAAVALASVALSQPGDAAAAAAKPRLSGPSVATFTRTGGHNTSKLLIFNAMMTTSLVQTAMTNPDVFEKGGPELHNGQVISAPGGIHYEVLSPKRGNVHTASLTYDARRFGELVGQIKVTVEVTDAPRDNVTYTCETRDNLDHPSRSGSATDSKPTLLGCWFDADGTLNVGDTIDSGRGGPEDADD
jgi:hypothetical protein